MECFGDVSSDRPLYMSRIRQIVGIFWYPSFFFCACESLDVGDGRENQRYNNTRVTVKTEVFVDARRAGSSGSHRGHKSHVISWQNKKKIEREKKKKKRIRGHIFLPSLHLLMTGIRPPRILTVTLDRWQECLRTQPPPLLTFLSLSLIDNNRHP